MSLSQRAATGDGVTIRPGGRGLGADLAGLWQHRELLGFLVWRDVAVRYKQTWIGVAWAVLQPLLMMGLFTVIFGRLAQMPSDGSPYAVFVYSALIPWTYFSKALSLSAMSVVSSSALITKVYFPRLIVPVAAVLSPLVDLAASLAVLLGIMIWYGIYPTIALLALPFSLLLAIATALAAAIWLSALNVRYRDVGYALPTLVQIGLYASPVVYPVSLVPEKWRLLYSLNPMAGVIESFRWAMLGKGEPDLAPMVVSACLVAALMLGGLVYFRTVEHTFADVI